MAGGPSYPTSRLEYDLPPELIAQHPASARRASRLLHVDVANSSFRDMSFADLPSLLPDACMVVMNNSRVIPARVYGRRVSGGRVEVLYHGREQRHVYRVLMKSRAPLPAGETIFLPEDWQCELLEPKQLDGSLVRITHATGEPVETPELHAWLDRHGIMPLPPYIHRDATGPDGESGEDRERYQTVYAQDRGSVAAPTAGLHFDDAMLGELQGNGHAVRFVTLHVGMGTFAPLRVDDLSQHSMHGEDFTVDLPVALEYLGALRTGRPVMAVGTTSLRVLHTIVSEGRMPQPDAVTVHGSTHTFIYPGQPTVAADLLLTNFHLPKSTLLALVYAFGGEELMRRVYNHAVEQRYRFFSYGDCMLIDRRNSAT